MNLIFVWILQRKLCYVHGSQCSRKDSEAVTLKPNRSCFETELVLLPGRYSKTNQIAITSFRNVVKQISKAQGIFVTSAMPEITSVLLWHWDLNFISYLDLKRETKSLN